MAAGYYAITQSIQGSAAEHELLRPCCAGDGHSGAVRRSGRNHRANDEYRERLRQGVGFAGGRDYVRGCAEPAGVHLGISDAAGDDASGDAGADGAYRGVRVFLVSDLRSEPAGAVQHQRQSAAAQSGAAGQEVFRGDADSGWRGRDQLR